VFLTKPLRALVLITLVATPFARASAQTSAVGGKLLPEKIGDFSARPRSAAPARVSPGRPTFRPEDFAVTGEDERTYAGAGGSLFHVKEIKTNSTSAAFSLLGRLAGGDGATRAAVVDGLGVFGVAEEGRVRFIKGDAFYDVRDASAGAKDTEALRAFAKAFADSLPGEAGFVPVLALHLPEYDKRLREGVGFAVTLPTLQEEAGARPVLDALNFDESTEAVTTKYGDARLVIVEFPTPQHAFDADAAVNKRIAELKAAGQPVPSSYKREGNYSVFVFDAPDAASADKLASGVKYEKDVRWLGRNPHEEEIVTRAYTTKMGGVILTTLITTGLAILLCLGVGGIVGGAIFMSRRARHAAQEIYSDAGGMLRLNLEDLNTPTPQTKMLGRGED
jgi:hypothetical protein